MQEYKANVSPENSGKRLDVFLCDFFKERNLGFSRTFIHGLITRGAVGLKKGPVLKPHYKVKAADEFMVLVDQKPTGGLAPEDIALDVVYEDADLAVINKPCGLVVHPAPGNYEHTLVNALLYRFANLSDVNPKRPGIVHRLDKDTSGLLVIAKNNFSHLNLVRQFQAHAIKRKYIALVKGCVRFDEDIIELPIGRHPRRRKNMSVGFGKKTKYARTFYRTIKRTDAFSLLELEPFTGRTHQLRVHLAFLGHPVLGDIKYGKAGGFTRLALHAMSIGFIHPRTKKFMEFSSEIPIEFRQALRKVTKSPCHHVTMSQGHR
jgi:23S rRNA pseudouridine1911/1915/1917 synthase